MFDIDDKRCLSAKDVRNALFKPECPVKYSPATGWWPC